MNAAPLNKPDYSFISLRTLAAPLFRRKRTLAVAFLTVFLAIVLGGLLLPPRFASRMAILVDRERVDPLVSTGSASQQAAGGEAGVTLEEINSEAELLLSPDVLEKVVRATGLADRTGPSLLGFFERNRSEAARVERAVRQLEKTLKVANRPSSNMIDVAYSSSDPKLAYGVLKALSGFYLEKHAAVHRPVGSYEFFARETEKYRQALQESEARLKSFAAERGGAAPNVERDDLAQEVAGAIGRMHQIQQAAVADRERIQSDRTQMKDTPERTETKQESNAANLLLEQLGSALLAAETKRIQLGMKYDSHYPLVQEADAEIAETKAEIARAEASPYVNRDTDRDPTYELLREDLVRSRADLAAQQADLAAVRQSIQSMQTQMGDLDRMAVTQQDLLREVKTNEDNYLLYLAKREQERASNALDRSRIFNVVVAVPPDMPVLPVASMHLILLLAFGAALAASFGLVYVLDYLDPSFHTPAQVVDMLGIPVVVDLPKKTA